MNKKKLGFLIGFFIVLFLAFYFALTRLVPGFGNPSLPVLSQVPHFFFENQEGKLVTDKDLLGKVYVAEYFFTTCRGICPKLNRNMKEVAEAMASQPDFRILSYTVDPETDSVARMKHYADSLGADPQRWWFLTGRKDSLYRLARNGYLLDDPKNNALNINEQFLHTQFLALVDKGGRVRKIFDGLKKDELKELEKDVTGLLKENVDAPRFANSLFK
ncbi:MAG TPA: SCO family protein [Puia sp.]|nr:SCO family protein [Puia sp.]